MTSSTQKTNRGGTHTMFSAIRRRFTYANVAMTLALVFAMTGGAYAAKHYLITSTKQISPKVLSALKGKAGPAGKNGTNGANGAPGEKGPAGSQGPQGPKGETGSQGPKGDTGATGQTGFTSTLPSGKTEKGDWSIDATATAGFQILLGSTSFVIPLEPAPIPIYVMANKPAPKHCSGSAANPGAEPGYLCVFASHEEDIYPGEPGLITPNVCGLGIQGPNECLSIAGSDPSGFGVVALTNGPGPAFANGTWAVTAE